MNGDQSPAPRPPWSVAEWWTGRASTRKLRNREVLRPAAMSANRVGLADYLGRTETTRVRPVRTKPFGLRTQEAHLTTNARRAGAYHRTRWRWGPTLPHPSKTVD